MNPTVGVVVGVGSLYLTLDSLLVWTDGGRNGAAAEALFQQVPADLYWWSSVSFLAAFLINLVHLLDERRNKRNLAILCCFISALAGLADYRLVAQPQGVWFDSNHHPLQTRRYLHFAASTPTIVFLISRVSDFPPRRVWGTCALQAFVIAAGFVGSLVHSPWKWIWFWISSAACACVMRNLSEMISRALARPPRRQWDMRGMRFVLWYTLGMWTLFPLAWAALNLGLVSFKVAEMVTVFANFAAKAVFSSSMVYDSFDASVH